MQAAFGPDKVDRPASQIHILRLKPGHDGSVIANQHTQFLKQPHEILTGPEGWVWSSNSECPATQVRSATIRDAEYLSEQVITDAPERSDVRHRLGQYAALRFR